MYRSKVIEEVRCLAIVLAVVAVALLTATSHAQADDSANVYLPLVGRSVTEIPRSVRQLTVKARLAPYKPRSETCDLDRQVVDHGAQIRIVDAETGEVLTTGTGEVEFVTYADTGLAYGVHFDPGVAPRRRCPNLMRHREEFVNAHGVYEIVEVLHYDPTR